MNSAEDLTQSVAAPNSPRQGSRLWPAVGLGLSVAGVGFAALFLYTSVAYGHRLMPGTFIADQNVSGLTTSEAVTLLNQRVVPQQKITVQVGEAISQPTPSELGISYPVKETVSRAYTFGHEASIWTQLGSIIRAPFTQRHLALSSNVATPVLDAYVNTIVANTAHESKDATLTIQQNQVVVVPAQAGQAIDGAKLEYDLLTAAGKLATSTVTAKLAVVTPTVTESALTAWKDRLVALANIPVTVTTDSGSVTIPTADKLTWYNLTNTGSFALTLNQDAVANTVGSLTSKLSKKPVNEQDNPDGSVAVPGQNGYDLNLAATINALVPKLQQVVADPTAKLVTLAAVVTVRPMQKVVLAQAPTSEIAPAIDTDAKFIQISLAKQRMYLFENRQLINTFTISSGKKGYETPLGVHQIYNKSVRAWSAAYSLWMPYWNAITADGEYGIHDLPEWPGGYKEPATHLGTPVSHGCIRLGSANAKYVFEWAPVGTAVVVQ